MAAATPPLTRSETLRVAALVARMYKRALAGDEVYQDDLKKKVDTILDAARKRAGIPR